jgi:hypothetical protein
MSPGIANVFQIVMLPPGSETFLHRDGTAVRAYFLAEKHALELVHPGIREQQGRIGLGNKRRAGDGTVRLFFKVLHKGPSEFMCAMSHDAIYSSDRMSKNTARSHLADMHTRGVTYA